MRRSSPSNQKSTQGLQDGMMGPMRKLVMTSLLFLVSCVQTPVEGPLFDPQACTEFALLQQFGLGWGRLNHRVSTWDVRLDQDGCRAERAEIIHIGGDFSTGASPTGTDDAPFLKLGWQYADTDASQVGVARVTIDAEVGPQGFATGRTSYRRTEVNLRHYPKVYAVIDGIAFDTGVEQSDDYPDDYDAAHGYTIRGFGGGAQVATVTDSSIKLDWNLHFELANSPDREDLNEAIEHATIGARLDVLLVGVHEASAFQKTVEYEMAYPKPEPLMDQQIDPPPAEKTGLTIAGTAGAPAGFWGVSRFDFQYQFDGACEENDRCGLNDRCADDGYCPLGREEPGEYLREITVTLNQDSYDAETGKGEFTFEGYTSNASRFIAYYALDYTFSGDMLWVQAGDNEDPERVEDEFVTGSYGRPLDPTYEPPPLVEEQ